MLDRNTTPEKDVPRSFYFDDPYFQRTVLFSLAAQIETIHSFGVKSILEIGPGNGFVADFLKKVGFQVTTIDVNPALSPDIVGSVLELDKEVRAGEYDLVVCCEVLEHIPFEDFDTALQQIARATSNFGLITLPTARPYFFELSGMFKLPKMKRRPFSIGLTRRAPSIYEGHHWEIGWQKECTLTEIKRSMSKYFQAVVARREQANPYHVFFRVEKKTAT